MLIASLVEEGDDLYPSEIKSGASMTGDMMEGLRCWARQSGSPEDRALLIYGGEDTATRNGIAVRPWFSIYRG